MQDGKESVDYDLQNLFTGDHKGSTFDNNGVMPLHVDRYVQVTTNWYKQDANGKPTPIKSSVNVNVESGKNYSTDPLSTAEIPQNYHLQEIPTNATGTTGAQNIIVNYIYVQNAVQQAQLNFVDDDDPSSTKMPASISAQGDAGSEINFKNQEGKSVAEIVEGLKADHYVLAKGGVVTNPSSTD
ncbi:MucBP domain-containing protein [Limosilactobacillus sp. c11Ua_112_M]|uniref:MucBP domain-containing protein n=1 Tax=Limosilactobacillus TaxID=2742598 RepID=UPI001786EA94|nr:MULTISPECIES: MucBP domain-containing protein [Limosilactobacillus]MBD8087619.1 MucBP domain-containing protein [Limosilactobacillus portuensis]MEC4742079.1 MucBP domain-containing protein [Limosilactobacillus sp. c10Ua_36]